MCVGLEENNPLSQIFTGVVHQIAKSLAFNLVSCLNGNARLSIVDTS